MVLCIFNEYRKIFFKVKNKIITDFWAYFMGVLSLQGEKDPPRTSWLKQKTKKD